MEEVQMNEILTEKQYQHFIMDYLKNNNGYVVRKDKEYDRYQERKWKKKRNRR